MLIGSPTGVKVAFPSILPQRNIRHSDWPFRQVVALILFQCQITDSTAEGGETVKSPIKAERTYKNNVSLSCGCGFIYVHVLRDPIILKQSSRSLLNARRFSQGSPSILLRSLLFGLMILLWPSASDACLPGIETQNDPSRTSVLLHSSLLTHHCVRGIHSKTYPLTSPPWPPFPPSLPHPISPIPLSLYFFPHPSLSFNFSLPPSLTADRYLGLNWLKGERKPVELRRQAVGGDPAYLPDLFMLQE